MSHDDPDNCNFVLVTCDDAKNETGIDPDKADLRQDPLFTKTIVCCHCKKNFHMYITRLVKNNNFYIRLDEPRKTIVKCFYCKKDIYELIRKTKVFKIIYKEPPLNHRASWSSELKDELWKYYKKGKTIHEICKIFKRTVQSIEGQLCSMVDKEIEYLRNSLHITRGVKRNEISKEISFRKYFGSFASKSLLMQKFNLTENEYLERINQIRINTFYKKNKKDKETKAIKWLTECETTYECSIRHKENKGEQLILVGNIVHYTDGFSKKITDETKDKGTIFEFNGCYYHGCDRCYEGKKALLLHPQMDDTYENLYKNTQTRRTRLSMQGYNVISMWECDWDNENKEKNKIEKEKRKSEEKRKKEAERKKKEKIIDIDINEFKNDLKKIT